LRNTFLSIAICDVGFPIAAQWLCALFTHPAWLWFQTSALQNNGRTIFVVAEGLLKTKIKKDIHSYVTDDNHIFISQFTPEMSWNAGNAMRRNKTIIGLSEAMILIESGKSGGTFAAGNQTLLLRRPLFVIDFEKPEVSAEANPYFISHGGLPIRGKQGIPNLNDVFKTVQSNTLKTKENKQGSIF